MKNQYVDPAAFLEQVHPEMNERYPCTDLGDGRLFADCHKESIRFVPERKCFYVYQDGVWVQDLGGLQTMEHCKAFAEALKRYASKICAEYYAKHCNRWQRRSIRETIIKEAQGIHPISILAFDADLYTVNCRNGTLHLDTMEFTAHMPGDYLTKMCPVDYNPDAQCDRFNRFINEITSGDSDKAQFLQKAMGYALSGDTRYECMFILHGATTRNGKSTLCESVRKVVGTYGCSANPETLGVKAFRSSHAPSEDVASLAGIRYLSVSEPDKGLVFSAALVKSLTGNNTIKARNLYENSFEFPPRFKIFLDCNHLPIISDMTLFSSRRLMIIPFDKHFSGQEQDKTLKTLFALPENQSAILNWLIDGYRLLRQEGLNPPESVRRATGIYEEDSDDILHFVQERLIENPAAEVRTSQVYAAYRSWCSENGIPPETSRCVNDALRRIARVERKRPRSGGGATTLLLGYELLPPEIHQS